MEQPAQTEGRDATLWLLGLPLAVVAATLTLLLLFSAVVDVERNERDLLFFLFLVASFGVPSAIIAHALNKRRQRGVAYYTLAGAAAGQIGFAALIMLLIWADGRQDIVASFENMTWSKAAKLTAETIALAWPGAPAGLAGGLVFGAFAKWASKGAA
jgi:hypothetical protein